MLRVPATSPLQLPYPIHPPPIDFFVSIFVLVKKVCVSDYKETICILEEKKHLLCVKNVRGGGPKVSGHVRKIMFFTNSLGG